MRRAPLAAVLVGAAVVGGCATQAQPPAPVAAPPSTAPPPSSAAPPSTSGTPTSTAPPDGGRCVLTDLSAETAPPQGSSGQKEVRVVWTNVSDRSCTMTGFGGVDLVASPRSDDRYSLPRQERATSTVRLAPGERAHSTITYLPEPSGYAASKIFATPPDETHSIVLDWPGGPVLRQAGATRPGNYLGPVQAGAS
ncbi:DUF4232 domain-containing protein [Actinomycetospora sp. C-140]